METYLRWGHFDGSEPRPVPKDSDNPTTMEVQARKQWDREDQIARNLLNKRLPDRLIFEVRKYPTAEERWHIVKNECMAKSVYARHALHQSFLDMQCPKGGDVRAFLESLKMRRNELEAAGVTITEAEFEHTVLRAIPDWLASYTSQLLGNAILNGKSHSMSVIIQLLSDEADRVKTRNVDKEQPPVKGKRAAQMGDEALIVTNSHEGGNPRRRKGKCNHCGKEGHWARECRTKKREEEAAATAAAAANPNGQAAQANSGTKPENRPVGSANAVYPNDSDEDGFWAVEEEAAHAYPDHVEPDPLMGEPDTNVEEAFRAESWGAEDDNALNWVGFDDWLVEKGEERDVENEPKAVTTTLVEDAPHIESQPVHYHALHALTPSHTPVSRGPPDEEEVPPRNVSPRGEHVANTLGRTLLERVRAMRHAVWLPTPPPRDCNVRAHNPDGPKPETHVREGQRHSSGIDAQAHPPSEPDVQAASAVQLEGEELWGTAMSSEQPAAPSTPSSLFQPPSSPLMPADSEATAPAPRLFSEPKNPPVQPHKSTRTRDPSCIEHDPHSGGTVHTGTNAPRFAHGLQAPGTFAKDPDKAGGVTMEGDGARAPLTDPDDAELAFVATIANTGAPDPRMLAEETHSPDWPPTEEPTEENPAARKVRPVAQEFSKPGITDHVDTHAKVARVAANSGHAYWEAIKWTLQHPFNTHDSSFTHIVARSPSEGYADANADAASSTAEDRRAISERVLPIDGDTTTSFSKLQHIAISPTSGSGHAAATHSGREASWHRSPDPDTFGGLKGHTTTAAIAPTRDRHHQHHPHQALGDGPAAAPDEAPARSERDCSSSPGRRGVDVIASRTPFPAYYSQNDAVTDVPTGPLLPAKERHFTAFLGLRAK